MADKKFSELTLTDLVNFVDILAVLKLDDTTESPQGTIRGLTIKGLVKSIRALINPAVQNNFDDINDLINNQINQSIGFLQYVQDASADPQVVSGGAFYNYNGGDNENLSDYTLVSVDLSALELNTSIPFEVPRIFCAPGNFADGQIRAGDIVHVRTTDPNDSENHDYEFKGKYVQGSVTDYFNQLNYIEIG